MKLKGKGWWEEARARGCIFINWADSDWKILLNRRKCYTRGLPTNKMGRVWKRESCELGVWCQGEYIQCNANAQPSLVALSDLETSPFPHWSPDFLLWTMSQHTGPWAQKRVLLGSTVRCCVEYWTLLKSLRFKKHPPLVFHVGLVSHFSWIR